MCTWQKNIRIHFFVVILALSTGCSHDRSVPPEPYAGSATLGIEGGSVSGANDAIKLEIPAGALLGATTITLTPIAAVAGMPDDVVLTPSSAFRIDWTGAGFAPDATVSILYPMAGAAVAKAITAAPAATPGPEGLVLMCNNAPAYVMPAAVTLHLLFNYRMGGCSSGVQTGQVTSQALAITQQPANVAIQTNGAATIRVVATGTRPLSYQWHRNGAAIAGATSASYSIASVTNANHGDRFSVVVSNAFGSVTSNVAELTVNQPQPMVWSAPTVAVDYGTEVDVPSAGASFFGAGVVIANGTLRLLDVTPAPPYVPLTGVARARPVAVGGLNSLLHAVLFATNTTGSTCFGGNRLNAIAIREGSEGGAWAFSPVPLFTAAGSDCIFTVAGAHGPRGFEFAVTDSSGRLTVGAFDINYNIAAATWSTPVVASAPLVVPSECAFPSLDRDSMGAAWDVMATNAPQNTTPPRIAVLAFNGGVGAVRSTCAATRAADGSWSAAAPVWNNGTDAAGAPVFAEPMVAMDLAGNVLLAGSRGTANGDELATAYLSAAASTWQIESSLPTFGVVLPSLGFDANGNAMLLYRTRPEAAAAFTTVYSARRLASGQWQSRQRIWDADVDTRLPRLSMTPLGGEALALFSANVAGKFQVFAARYSNGNWGPAGSVQPDGSPEGRFAVASRYFVNADVSGGFRSLRAYWRETNPSGARIMSAEVLAQ